MNSEKWKNFQKTRKKFRITTDELSSSLPGLKKTLQKFADSRSENSYTVDTPVVYNTALDDIKESDKIKLILVADNPGRREQAAENRRYLIGPSGKIAKKFFTDNPSLGIEFEKNVIILNKTPIHTPRTIELREICKSDNKLIPILEKSQIDMALLLLEFQESLSCPVWITGYSEMRRKGIFEIYTQKLKEIYSKKNELYQNIFIYRHFSMNQFTIDLKQQSQSGETVSKTLKRIGTEYKKRIIDKF